MEIEGIVLKINPEETFGTNGFRKRELVIETDEQYKQKILIEFVQDKCDLLNNYKLGDGVKVSINLRGREWVNPEGISKYFNQIQGWRIEDAGASEQQPNTNAAPLQTQDEAQDLPF